jgi:hypothetical protein
VGDPVEPGAKVSHLVGPLQGVVGVDQRLLDGVLGPAGADDAGAVARERRPVAIDDGVEGGLVAIGGELGEALVALQAQQRRTRQAGGVAQRGRAHRLTDQFLRRCIDASGADRAHGAARDQLPGHAVVGRARAT